MKIIKIDNTDIFLDDQGDGCGKITISNTYNMNFSYYWGSMGRPLEEFLMSINEIYFIKKLSYNTGVFCGKKTATAIRKHIREECSYELAWYKHMEFQKGLREFIKDIENLEDGRQFVDYCFSAPDDYRLDFNLVNRIDRDDVKEEIDNIFCQEPWYYIQERNSDEWMFLSDLFKKLQKELKKI